MISQLTLIRVRLILLNFQKALKAIIKVGIINLVVIILRCISRLAVTQPDLLRILCLKAVLCIAPIKLEEV